MALSNWDTYSIDEKSQPTNGVFNSAGGITVEFYKNWLYISDAKGWTIGSGFIKPVVAQLWSGELLYKDTNIKAWRGPKNGIYAFVWSGASHQNALRIMAGIGCYGFDDETWVGVQPVEIQFLASKCPPPNPVDIPDYTQLKTDAEKEAAYAKTLLAIEAEEARDILHVAEIRELGLNFFAGRRFNQGDAYFAKAAGADLGDIATPPGEAQDPLLIRGFKQRPKEGS